MSMIDRKKTVSSREDAGRILRRFFNAGLLHVVLTALCFAAILPFLWMVLTSLKPLSQVDSPNWLPTGPMKFAPDDVKHADTLLDMLTKGRTPLAEHLRAHIPDEDLEAMNAAHVQLENLTAADGSVSDRDRADAQYHVSLAVVHALNEMIVDVESQRRLYDETIVSNIQLRYRTRSLLRQVQEVFEDRTTAMAVTRAGEGDTKRL